jgi:superfamily II DNA helicase RecQ
MQGDRAMKFKVFTIRLKDGYREQDEAHINQFLETVEVKQIFASPLNEGGSFWSILLYYEGDDTIVEATADTDEDETVEQDLILSAEEEQVFVRLKRWRNERAMQEGIPPYMIAHNAWLKAMVRLPVQTKDDLLRIKGFGERRTQKFGDEILAVLYGEGRNNPEYFDF